MRVLAKRGAELVVHGHLHRRLSDELEGPHASIPVYGTNSSTWLSKDPNRQASYLIYTITDNRVTSIEERRFDVNRRRFVDAPPPVFGPMI